MIPRPTAYALCTAMLAIGAARASGGEVKGDVKLTISADREQPAGWPVVLSVTVENVGKEEISWWCGGPETYPGAEHFVVQVRDSLDSILHEVAATNGQYTQGSGWSRKLAPGRSIVVPLAVPVRKFAGPPPLGPRTLGVIMSVQPRDWHAAEPAQYHVTVTEYAGLAEKTRVSHIQSLLSRNAFWTHVAERYPDPVITDAMLKLVTLDCAPVVSVSARVLARQAMLPREAGEDLGMAVNRWLPRKAVPDWGGLQDDVVRAALATRSVAARQAVLDLLQKTADLRTRTLLIGALAASPGDREWLELVRSSFVRLQQQFLGDAELVSRAQWGMKWIASRLKAERAPTEK